MSSCGCDECTSQAYCPSSKIEELEGKLKQAEEALAYYAGPGAMMERPDASDDVSKVTRPDGYTMLTGKRARAALSALSGTPPAITKDDT